MITKRMNSTSLMMKSIKELSLNISEPEYRKLGGFSYSMLAKFLRSGDPKVLVTPSHDESDALRFGSLVDCLMTEPDLLEDRFFITSMKTPSPTITSIMLYIYKKVPNAKSFTFVPNEVKLEALDNFDYATSWSSKTRLDRLDKQSFYYTLLQRSEGKIVMSEEDLTLATLCVKILKTHPFTEKYMGDEDPFNPKIEKVNQLKFSSTYHRNLIRCMFDRIIVDHDAKTIQPIDLKTSGKKEEKFELSALEWDYYIQASMYTQILLDVISEDEYFKDFTILPFKFVVINRFERTPMVWSYPFSRLNRNIIDDQQTLLQKNGYKSWRELIKEAAWHIENNKFDYSYETYMSGGERTIDFSKYLR